MPQVRSGFDPASFLGAPELDVACVRVASRLRAFRTVGLLPSGECVAALPAGVHLAEALAFIQDHRVALLDANLRWPAGVLFDDAWQVEPGGRLRSRAPRERVVLFSSVEPASSKAALDRWITLVLAGLRTRFWHVFVDLTGWKQLGVHLSAIEQLDGVLVVARAGLTTERELLRLQHELSPDRNLGVLLVGGEDDL